VPTFSIRAIDKGGSIQLRAATRPKHLEHLAAHSSQIIVAGALLDEIGQHPVGSLLVVEAATASEVRTLMEADPYFKAGLFESVEFSLIRLVYPSSTDFSTERIL
jgi:uncharacterized protein YciI